MILNFSKAEIVQKCELIATITVAQMKSRYRKTFAGFLWVVLNPILTFVVQAIIFKHILKIEIENYFVYLLAGLVPWVFLMSSLNMTVTTFVANRSTLMAFKIDPWIFLISQVLDNFVNFIASFLVIILFVERSLFLNAWFFPLLVLMTLVLVIYVFYLCFFLATLNVFFRDTQYIMQFITTLAIFVTPVFYPITLLPLHYQKLVQYNPFYIILVPFQNLLWKYDLDLFFKSLLNALGLLILTAMIAIIYWRKVRHALFFRL